ncbi:hypothetical protein RvY_11033 [Ramazzottius varieornatus]|uniref:K Homology domain-containing protein n=1 Tax=Ramazzottius varieornatus TaxID=947166 RepID=A0A1D1VJ67_RAMVA|nr:hypothetical protein RvY_11033 [Ramazzottius varieornatus]
MDLPEEAGPSGSGTGAVAGSSAGDKGGLSYADAFPSLPDTGRPALPTTSPWAARPAHTSRPALQSNIAHEKLVISYEERRLKSEAERFGREGESERSVCVDIQKETGVSINMTQNKDGSLTLLITGKKEEARRARNLALQRLQSQANIALNIPKEYHRFLLGPKGAVKQEIESATATKIFVPRMDEDSDAIRISGPKESIDSARQRIMQIYEEQSKRGAERIPIPKAFHPFVMGPNNATVERLRQQYAVQIHVPPPSVQQDEIGVTGEKEAVAFVKNELLKIYNDVAQRSKVLTVEVPRGQHRYVQGPRSANLHHILERTGVWVELPAPDSDSSSVTLRGDPAKFGQALNIVWSKANSVVRVEVAAPNWIHKHMIGRGGDKVRELSQKYPEVHIRYNTEGDRIEIEGPPNDVNLVRQQLESESKELVETLALQEMTVDEKFMKHIIGKNGANVGRLKAELGVQIRSQDGAKQNVLIVEGAKSAVVEAVKNLKERIGKMENERARDMIIDRRLHKLIIGQKGERIREIREHFKETNVLFPDAEDNSDIVTVRGPKEEVDKCFKYLEKLVKDLVVSNHRIEVPIFKDMHRSIIGKGGATIRKIREETETKIDLPAENSDSDVITITGKKENAEKARDMIQKIQNELANAVEVKVQVPNKLHTHLIGKNGRTIKGIIQECGNVRIQLPKTGETSDIITVTGPKADADKAAALIRKMADDHELSSFSLDVAAKPEYHKYLRNHADSIRRSHNVRIVFPGGEDEQLDVLTIIGKKEEVEKAKAEVDKLLKELQNTVEESVEVPVKHQERFLARRGEVLQEIERCAGSVGITFPWTAEVAASETVTVALRGPREAVDKARSLLLAQVQDWEAEISSQVDIAPRFYGSIMGPKGQRVNQIQQDHKVRIKFPERREEQRNGGGRNGGKENEATSEQESPLTNGDGQVKKEMVTITGRPEDVEAAKEALLALVPVVVEMSVPFDYHRSLIGKGGSNIRKLMEAWHVNINVPNPEAHSDIIKLTGLPRDIEAAKKGMEEQVAALDKQKEERALRSYRVEMRVDPKYHFKLIGRGGVEVNKLRKDFDVEVQFPRDSDGPDNADRIILLGYEDKAKAARDKIQSIIDAESNKVILEVMLDSRIHNRIIGGKGLAIRKFMDKFKVDVRFPRREDDNPNLVVITGDTEEAVYDAETELKRLEDDYLDQVADNSALSRYHAPSRYNEDSGDRPNNGSGFVIQGAPWQKHNGHSASDGNADMAVPSSGDTQEFPSLGNGALSPPLAHNAVSASRWAAPR